MGVKRLVSADSETGKLPDVVLSWLKDNVELRGSLLPQLRGVRYIAYGHSFGQVQNPANAWPNSVYPARIRDEFGTDPSLYQNRTISGSSMSNIAARAVETWNQGDYGLVTLMGNQNTVGADHASPSGEANFKSAVRQFLNHVRGGTTVPPTVVVVADTRSTATGYARYGSNPPTDSDVARFNTYLRQVVAEYPQDGSILLADADAGWDPVVMTCPDGQHPNDRGMAHIATAIVRALRSGSFREGLNRGIATTTPAPPTPITPIGTDSFNRADNATSLGSTENGQAWVTLSGTVFGIVSNQAKTSTNLGESGYAWFETAKSDVDVAVVLGRAPSAEGLGPVMRLSDLNNCFIADCEIGGSTPGVTLYKRVNGDYVSLGKAGSPKVGDTVVMRGRGGAISVLLNGTEILTATDSFNQTSTKHGIRVTSAANAIDSIQVSG